MKAHVLTMFWDFENHGEVELKFVDKGGRVRIPICSAAEAKQYSEAMNSGTTVDVLVVPRAPLAPLPPSASTPSPFDKARAVFNSYAGMDEPDLPKEPGPALQVAHYRWAQLKVPKHTLWQSTEGILGMTEELGEAQEALNKLVVAVGRLAHIELNVSQGRRGYDAEVEKLRRLVADGLADHGVFAMHLATAFRLDYWTLVSETAREVMAKRDWKQNPLTATSGPLNPERTFDAQEVAKHFGVFPPLDPSPDEPTVGDGVTGD